MIDVIWWFLIKVVIVINVNVILYGLNSLFYDFLILVVVDFFINNFCIGISWWRIGKKISEIEKWNGIFGVVFLLILLVSVLIFSFKIIFSRVIRMVVNFR